MLDVRRAIGRRRERRLFSAAGLNTGLFVCADDGIIGTQWSALTDTLVKRKRSAFSCKSRSQRRPSPRLSASRGPPFTALSRQGGYAHILKGYFYTNLVGTLI